MKPRRNLPFATRNGKPAWIGAPERQRQLVTNREWFGDRHPAARREQQP